MKHRLRCPFCEQPFVQDENPDGPNFCPICQRLFRVQQGCRMVPNWVLGIVVLLLARWLAMREEKTEFPDMAL